MIVTEEEAKTKRCQETMGPVGTADRVWIKQSSDCIGSACMAWRWKRGSFYELKPGTTNEFIQHEDQGEYSATHGYCGKAGKP